MEGSEQSLKTRNKCARYLKSVVVFLSPSSAHPSPEV